MKLRRRIAIKVEASARFLTKALFWMRRGHTPAQAWSKAGRTL